MSSMYKLCLLILLSLIMYVPPHNHHHHEPPTIHALMLCLYSHWSGFEVYYKCKGAQTPHARVRRWTLVRINIVRTQRCVCTFMLFRYITSTLLMVLYPFIQIFCVRGCKRIGEFESRRADELRDPAQFSALAWYIINAPSSHSKLLKYSGRLIFRRLCILRTKTYIRPRIYFICTYLHICICLPH